MVFKKNENTVAKALCNFNKDHPQSFCCISKARTFLRDVIVRIELLVRVFDNVTRPGLLYRTLDNPFSPQHPS